MVNNLSLVPPPEIVRQRLARNLRECEVLRKLLRLSEQAVEVQASAEHYEAEAVESAGRASHAPR